MKRIPTPAMGEFLSQEFMKPLGLSAYKLANDIHVPVSRIQDILHGRRTLSVDTALRLSKYFGLSERYFLNIQNDIEIRSMKEAYASDYDSIITIPPVHTDSPL